MTLRRLFLISRPLGTFNIILSFIAGVGNFGNFNTLVWIELLMFTFPLNYYLYSLNDYFDRGTDKLNPRKGNIEGALISSSEAGFIKKTYWIPALIALLISLSTQNPEHIFAMGIYIFSCFAYSHQLLRFKGVPILDTFTSALVYLSPILVAYTTHSSLREVDSRLFSLMLPAAGIHGITTLGDKKWDKKAGIKTFGVVFGRKKTFLTMALYSAISLFFLFEYKIIAAVLIMAIIMSIGGYITSDKRMKSSFTGLLFMTFWGTLLTYSILIQN